MCPENGYKFEIKDENTLFMSFIGEPELDMAQEVLANLNNLKRESKTEFDLNALYTRKAWYLATLKTTDELVSDSLKAGITKDEVSAKYLNPFETERNAKCGVIDDGDSLS